jgi:hypothetical protein
MFCLAFMLWLDQEIASVDLQFHNYRFDGCMELIDTYYDVIGRTIEDR